MQSKAWSGCIAVQHMRISEEINRYLDFPQIAGNILETNSGTPNFDFCISHTHPLYIFTCLHYREQVTGQSGYDQHDGARSAN